MFSDGAIVAGDVGIGTDVPQEKLHIVGNELVTGDVDVGGTVIAEAFSGDGNGGPDITITPDGNVGIGTTDPTFNLHIRKTATLGLQNENAVVGSEMASITAGDANVANKAKIVFINGGDYGESSEIAFYTSEEYTGNLHKAITISESKRLTCFGEAFFEEGINLQGNVFLNGYWIKKHNFGSGGIYLGSGNNVGIGTDDPDATLDVAGDIICGAIEVMDLGEWKDYVFNEDYNLRSLKETEEFIKQNHHLPDIPSEAEVLENGYNMGEMDAMLLQKIEELTLYIIEQSKEIIWMKNQLKDINND